MTLFAVSPEVVKDVVYTMRFDKASALYGEFGRFYVGYLTDISSAAGRRRPLTSRVHSANSVIVTGASGTSSPVASKRNVPMRPRAGSPRAEKSIELGPW